MNINEFIESASERLTAYKTIGALTASATQQDISLTDDKAEKLLSHEMSDDILAHINGGVLPTPNTITPELLSPAETTLLSIDGNRRRKKGPIIFE